MSERPAGAAEETTGIPSGTYAYVGIVALYAATIVLGLALTDEVAAMGLAMFEDPGNVGNVGVFAAILLVATAGMVAAFRYGYGEALVRAFLLGSASTLTAVAFVALTGVGEIAASGSVAMGLPTSPASIAVAAVTFAVLWTYPEWYVNDIAAVVFGAAAIPMLGLGFGPLPVVVLLVAWAGYDAYAVYVSGHMQELAAGLGDLKAPIVFVVPHSRSFSMRDPEFDLMGGDESSADGAPDTADGDRPPEGAASPARSEVALLGLGDAIIPGMLAVSAGRFLDAPTVVPALNANAPALGALVGGLVGMAGLLYLVHRVEGAHAGLPPLNAGVLGGYLVGAVAAGVPVTTALGL
ncbi:presenilin family intramembrane aspartyl protease PSH [Halosimplex halophilum]|uniref:presenilin family intramembrane aspartyl protease PSH n=1 Tax=Halosimplex halophilum TaxID=2559572 RepID=UPI00107EEFF0|nr:presenilin family intramembrane aspartyl protease PSH [Halosimplex halophilum]